MAEISRRTLFNRALLLGAVGAGALLGLTRPVHHRSAAPPAPPPAELVAALDRQRQLLAGYDRILAGRNAVPGPAGLAGLRSDVAAHGEALRALLERYPGWRLSPGRAATAADSAPSPAGGTAASRQPTDSDVPATVPALAAASKAGAAAAAANCLAWPATDSNAALVVPLLASISASLSSHLQVLA
ncbi:MAG: hypothetical protein QOI26_1115 [Pseudonocardiales bacterium]|nr:hypothetical protein [Pseudonocardiales bacterium]